MLRCSDAQPDMFPAAFEISTEELEKMRHDLKMKVDVITFQIERTAMKTGRNMLVADHRKRNYI